MKKQVSSSRVTLPDPAQITLEPSLLEPVPPPVSPLNGMAITVSPSGHVALNRRLCDAVIQKTPSLRMDFSAYKDRTCLVLRPSETGSYKFPKGGRIKDVAFSRSLVKAGISLPARYVADWNPIVSGWVAILDTQAQTAVG